MASITHGQTISGLVEGQFARLEKISPAGTLEVRRLKTGVVFYWRVTAGGKTDRVTIGPYDPKAPPRSMLPTRRGHSVQSAIRGGRNHGRATHRPPG